MPWFSKRNDPAAPSIAAAHPRSEAGPGPGVADLVAAYPGPALHVAADGRVLAANAPAEPFCAGGAADPWWQELFDWLTGDDAAEHPFKLISVETDRGSLALEWAAMPLPDNTVVLLGRDVTLERNVRQALSDSRQRLRDFVDLGCDLAWETGGDGCFVYVSPNNVLCHDPDALVGRPAEALLVEPSLARSPFEARQPLRDVPLLLWHGDGTSRAVRAAARPIFDTASGWLGVRGVCRLDPAPPGDASVERLDEPASAEVGIGAAI